MLSEGDFIPIQVIKSLTVYGESKFNNQAFIQAVLLTSTFSKLLLRCPTANICTTAEGAVSLTWC